MRSAWPSITTASTPAQSASFPITSRSRRAFAASVSAYRSNGNVSSFWKASVASHRFGAATGAGAGAGAGAAWRGAGAGAGWGGGAGSGAAAQDARRPRTALPIASFSVLKGPSWSWTRAAGRARRAEAGAPQGALRDVRDEQRVEPALREMRARGRRRPRQIPSSRRQRHLRGAGAHGAGLLHALHADRRAGELRLDRRR